MPPDLLLVVIDDLGASDHGAADASFTTPHLDALRASGTALTSLYALPSCSPSRAALLTGRYPIRYGLQDGPLAPTSPRGLPLEETLLAQSLASAGYRTAAVGKWHLGFHTPDYLPTARGFDRFYGILTGGGGHTSHVTAVRPTPPRRGARPSSRGAPQSAAAPDDPSTAQQAAGDATVAEMYKGYNLWENGVPAAADNEGGVHSTALYSARAGDAVDALSADHATPYFLYLA